MSDPLTDAANAISSSSPKVRAFAQLAAKRIIALEQAATPPAPVPPPPAASARVGNGLLLNAQGDSYPTLTAAQHKTFGGIIVGPSNEADVAALGGPHGFGYRCVFEVGTGAYYQWPNPLTIDTCRANGWLYHDAAGKEISLGNGNLCANVGHPGYQAAYVTSLQVADAKSGTTGHFFDNCDGNIWWGVAPVVSGITYADANVAADLLSFFTYVRTHMPKTYLLANVGEGYPDRWAWIHRLAGVTNGVCMEQFTGAPDELQAIHDLQAASRDPWAISKEDVTAPGAPLARTRAASFASAWDRKGGGFGFATGTWAPDPNWTTAIPAPLAP